MQIKNTSQGFTLVELMITVAIIAIISAIAIPAYRGYITTTRETEGHNNLAALQIAQEEFFLENNGYFEGANYSALQTASDGLWTRTGSNGTFNFTYAVTLSAGGYEAKATHISTGKELIVTK